MLPQKLFPFSLSLSLKYSLAQNMQMKTIIKQCTPLPSQYRKEVECASDSLIFSNLVELEWFKHKNITVFTNFLNLQPPPEIPGSSQCRPCMGVALYTQPQSPEGLLEVTYQMLHIKWLKYHSEWASQHRACCFL